MVHHGYSQELCEGKCTYLELHIVSVTKASKIVRNSWVHLQYELSAILGFIFSIYLATHHRAGLDLPTISTDNKQLVVIILTEGGTCEVVIILTEGGTCDGGHHSH